MNIPCRVGHHVYEMIENTAFYNGRDTLARYRCSRCGEITYLGDADRYKMHMKDPETVTVISPK